MEYLKHLDKNKKHPISVEVASLRDREVWQREVMPFEKSKTAKNWNWEARYGKIGKAKKIGNIFRQNPEFLIMKKGNIPIAIMLHVDNYFERVTSEKQKRTSMIWFVQKAPNEYLLNNNIDENDFDIKIAKAILDTGLIASLNESGSMILHADPSGGEKLIEFYRNEGFTQISKVQGRISKARVNDGRYFHMSKEKNLAVVFKNRKTINQDIKMSYLEKKLLISDYFTKEKKYKKKESKLDENHNDIPNPQRP